MLSLKIWGGYCSDYLERWSGSKSRVSGSSLGFGHGLWAWAYLDLNKEKFQQMGTGLLQVVRQSTFFSFRASNSKPLISGKLQIRLYGSGSMTDRTYLKVVMLFPDSGRTRKSVELSVEFCVCYGLSQFVHDTLKCVVHLVCFKLSLLYRTKPF